MKSKILGIALAAAMVAPAMAVEPLPPKTTAAERAGLDAMLKDAAAKLSQRKAASGQFAAATPTSPSMTTTSSINGLPAAPGWHLAVASICGWKSTEVGPAMFYMWDPYFTKSLVVTTDITIMAMASQACGVTPYGHHFQWHVVDGAIIGNFDEIWGQWSSP